MTIVQYEKGEGAKSVPTPFWYYGVQKNTVLVPLKFW